MKYTISKKGWDQLKTDFFVLFSFSDKKKRAQSWPEPLAELLTVEAFETGEFSAKKGELFVLPVNQKFPHLKRIGAVGLGEEKKFTLDVLRESVARVVQEAAKRKADKVAFWIPENLFGSLETERLIEEMALAASLANYRFVRFKSSAEEDEQVREIAFGGELVARNGRLRSSLQAAEAVAGGVYLARDLANLPANELPPAKLAEAAEKLAAEYGLNFQALGKKELAELGANALLSVAKGSQEEPCLIVLEYNGTKKDDRPYVLVGKGVTFDSGGISLKPGKNMDEMKFDMSGGAAVLGTMQAVAAMKLPIRVIGLVPAVENLPSGTATRPGDVVKALNGKTIEILNTDAEGRLILADALAYAERFRPRSVVDVATLTGAVVVAIGGAAAGLMGNNDALLQELREASASCGEKIWPFPLYEEYEEEIKSTVADIKNIGNRGGGVVTAGTFLKYFAEKYPWAHLDIAGVAWTTQQKPLCPKGATGFGVRLLVSWLRKKCRK